MVKWMDAIKSISMNKYEINELMWMSECYEMWMSLCELM